MVNQRALSLCTNAEMTRVVPQLGKRHWLWSTYTCNK